MDANMKRWLSSALLLLLLQPSFVLAANAKLYRYTDNKGATAVDDHVPPEFVKNGYDVITKDGRVIETVPRQLTGAEGERKRAAEAEAKHLQDWDKTLLLRYSSTDDIAAARDRALKEFDVRISILRSNLLSTKSQIESEQGKAADMERRGRDVPEAMTTNIEMLKREITDTEEAIAERLREKENVRGNYQKDIERFKTLQDVVEFRRRSGAASPK
jgi:hypothetical protein